MREVAEGLGHYIAPVTTQHLLVVLSSQSTHFKFLLKLKIEAYDRIGDFIPFLMTFKTRRSIMHGAFNNNSTLFLRPWTVSNSKCRFKARDREKDGEGRREGGREGAGERQTDSHWPAWTFLGTVLPWKLFLLSLFFPPLLHKVRPAQWSEGSLCPSSSVANPLLNLAHI